MGSHIPRRRRCLRGRSDRVIPPKVASRCDKYGAFMNGESSSSNVDWYYFDGRQAVGPFPWSTLLQLRQGGLIQEETQVTSRGDKEWRSFGSLIRPADAAETSTPSKPAQKVESPVAPKERSIDFPVRFGSSFVPSSAGFR